MRVGGVTPGDLTFFRNTTMSDNKKTQWADLAISLFDRLNERNARINYTFDDMVVEVPEYPSVEAPSAFWKVNGTISITTDSATGDHA